MPENENLLKKRILELAERSYNNSQYLFTNFLSPAELSDCVEVLEKNKMRYQSFGGTEMAEREVIKFGNMEEFGYDMEYPISCILVEPNLEKYAEELTHRDYLGSILNLGIERDIIGDIYIRGKTGYVICLSKMADYIAKNLVKIKHTYIKCKVADEMPKALEPKFENSIISASSERCDIVLAKLYHISRTEALELFREKKVCINGRIVESNSRNLKEGDIVSARGYGKFIYRGVLGVNKKEKYRVNVDRYA